MEGQVVRSMASCERGVVAAKTAATRFLDKKEMDARLKELRAAAGAGIPQDDLEYFRAAWLSLSLLMEPHLRPFTSS